MKPTIIFLLISLAGIFSQNEILFSQSDDGMRSGIDAENLNNSIDPNSDFYSFACSNWFDKNPIPGESSRWGTWDVIIEKNNEVLRSILEKAAANTSAPKGSLEQKLGDLYYTAMDTVKIEKDGIAPLAKYLAMIDGISNKDEFQKVLAYLKSIGTGGVFSFRAGQDDKNSNNVILNLYQSGLGLPGKEYYTKDDENSIKTREKYMEFMNTIFTFMGNDISTAANISRRIMDIEKRMADASMTRLEMRPAEATYHLMSLQEVRDLMPDYNFDVLFTEIGLDDLRKFDKGINVGQPEFFKEINQMITDVSIDDWKNYLKWNLVRNNVDKLSSDFENANFEFYGKTLRGNEVQKPRWKLC